MLRFEDNETRDLETGIEAVDSFQRGSHPTVHHFLILLIDLFICRFYSYFVVRN